MDFEKAKNISIIAFIILNIALGFLRYMDTRRYILSSEHQWAITKVLNNNNITLSDKFTFPRHNPKKQISLNSTTLNKNVLTNIFMEDTQGIRIMSENNVTIFETNYEKIYFKGSRIRYKNKANTNIVILSQDDAIEYSQQIIKSMGELGKDFVLDRIKLEQDKIILEYRQYYKNYILFTNYIIFIFEDNTIRKIDLHYNSINNFTGNPREIALSNEALMAFLREIRQIHKYELIIIESMDIVYKQQHYGMDYNTDPIALPFYRINYNMNTKEDSKKEVKFINAYTNIVE